MTDQLERGIASVQSTVLDLPPCCIEFSPFHPEYFVVGTYFLDRKDPASGRSEVAEEGNSDEGEGERKQPQHRTGSIKVYHVKPEAEKTTLIQTSFQPSALLDLHFHQKPDNTGAAVLVAVTSTGTVTFHTLDPLAQPSAPLSDLACRRFESVAEDTLILFCAWHPTEHDLMAVTTSDGRVILARVDLETYDIKGFREIPIENELENWFVALTPTDSTAEGEKAFTILSGGDDAVMRWTSCVFKSDDDVCTDNEDDLGLALPYPPATLRNQHMAGITAILPLPNKLTDGSTLLISGSYDDTIRLFAFKPQHETYGIRSCRLLAEKNLGGGVWRVKVMHESQDGKAMTLLVSCMYAGTRIVRLVNETRDDDGWTFQVLAKFEEHKSMNYGSEFVPGFFCEEGKERLVISTSFYDKLMCVWRSPV
ncbi:hypothetical protein TD95_004847 [Thielaviopsis punctulata]|uniref:Uncharacterized protein n=1 Tax=Thielaviopsis punctulata TaxID=72032 RepID=A0A0F4ZCZ9_9PEZI|nr:hypothetical protein TD95_004847 [Thielaviopsis punctulata]